jgi:hypothetical protein
VLLMAKHQKLIWPIVTLSAVILLSALLYYWVREGSFKVCTPQAPEEKYQKTIAALDAIVDLGLRLSTTLVGLGAALLIGLKSGLKLTGPIKILIIVSAVFFVQSALYAVWWRFGIAELWLNECLELVSEPWLDRRYQAHFYFFLAGLLSIGVLVISAVFAVPDMGEDT